MQNRPRRPLRERRSTPVRKPGVWGSITHFWRTKIRPHITKKRVIIAAIILFIIMLTLPIATYAYFARDIGDKERLMNRNNTGIILKDRNGTAFYSSGVRSTENVPLSQIADSLEKAVIASEDQNFYSHRGFSVSGTARAFTSNVRDANATGSGGSTITQQLVKNKLLSSKKNYLRKYQEISMAIAVERKYSKDEILEMYLNSAYFGSGAFGISDAARTYYDKKPADLTLAESAMLIGLLPAPSAYSPTTGDAKLAKESQTNVLRKMVDTKVISSEERDNALTESLTYASGSRESGDEYAQHFADMVLKELNEQYGEEKVNRSGFEITTTLDLNQQKEAEKIIKEQVAITSERGGRNAGLVAIDPKNGEVRAVVGSVDYYNQDFGQVNMATALRQPGSSFKPIYHSAAIDKELVTAATILDDKQTTFGGTYTPKNYDNRYKGQMPLRNALAESRNITAVQVMQKIGITEASKAATRMGISTVTEPQKYGLSLALGTAEVRLVEMVNAYAAFANQGQHYEPVYYTKIVDKYGEDIDEVKRKNPTQVLSADAAYITSSILSDAGARAPTLGTSLNISRQNVALKTGTTNDNRDAWTIGYTPSMVIGVWLGNNENEPMRGLAGGSGAGAIWKRAMTSYLKGKSREDFVKPSTVKTVAVCNGTGARSVNQSGPQQTHEEFFKTGAEPTETCNTDDEIRTLQEAEQRRKEEEERAQREQQEQQQNNQNNGNNQNNSGNTGEEEDEEDESTGPGGGRGSEDDEQPTPMPTQPPRPGRP
jgi:1A family penicillin-binding protein